MKEIESENLLDHMTILPYMLPMSRCRDGYKAQARILKALAHESRLLIIDRLSQSDCSAGELTQLVGSDQSTVSKHLAVLRAHGIVQDRREGSSVQYRLVTRCVTNFLSCAVQVLQERE